LGSGCSCRLHTFFMEFLLGTNRGRWLCLMSLLDRRIAVSGAPRHSVSCTRPDCRIASQCPCCVPGVVVSTTRMPATVLKRCVPCGSIDHLNACHQPAAGSAFIEPAGPLIASQVRQGTVSPALVIPDCLRPSRCPCR
jgi:hypothetical protein